MADEKLKALISKYEKLAEIYSKNADSKKFFNLKGAQEDIEKAKEYQDVFRYLRELTDLKQKQTPNLVIYASDGDFDGVPVYDMAYCPKCDYLFEDGDHNWEEPYCMRCGQALKWEVDVDE